MQPARESARSAWRCASTVTASRTKQTEMERSPHSDLHGAGPAYRAGVSLSAPWGRDENGREQPARSETKSGGCRSRTGCSLRSRALAGRLTHHHAVPSRTAVEGEGVEPSRSASRRSALSSNQAPTPIGVMPFYRGRCARSRTWLIGFGNRPRRRTLFARTYQKRFDSRRKEGESNPQGSSLGRAPDGSRRPSACPSVVEILSAEEGGGVEPPRLIAHRGSSTAPSPIGWPFRQGAGGRGRLPSLRGA